MYVGLSVGSAALRGTELLEASPPSALWVCFDLVTPSPPPPLLSPVSPGIDVLYCEHVVLFDFPRDPSEYVRRVGRTARGANGRGTVSSLVLGRQVPLAKQIIERNQKGMPVHTVPE